MLPWIIFSSICCIYSLCFLCVTPTSVSPSACNCYLTEDNPENATTAVHILKCERGSSSQIPCQRINDLIRIGPLEDEISVASIHGGLSVANKYTIKIAPWAFADLVEDGTVHHLQLDLHLPEHKVDALSLAGLKNLYSLMARTSLVRWDKCSFMSAPTLTKILMSCKSTFDEFITFGSEVRDVRFLDCEDVPLQFYCISCLQDPSTKVIRILPGPPLRQYMVKFSQFGTRNDTKAVSSMDNMSPLSIGKCIQNVCSDEMLCRDNMPLKLANANIGRPATVVFPTSDSLFDKQVTEYKTPVQTDASTAVQSTVRKDGTTNKASPKPSLSFWKNHLNERNRIWITISIVAVIILILFTLCVLISMTRQRNRKHRVKFTPAQACPSHSNCNGTVSPTQVLALTKQTKSEQNEQPT
ncbi:hypothetical protein CSKR_107049 [Clonorchis sinensis]|uniref:Uncharacterized protein n=2 Tax=Clonorchis sinensis TaxID=79923 RepID=H2KUP4_CLOSI|nr:hypothetical protein CSKR_107049 [Clonorchis sinensis]GAA34495.1 hypothetical protein CLF_109766 [Clonorchis sinensis]